MFLECQREERGNALFHVIHQAALIGSHKTNNVSEGWQNPYTKVLCSLSCLHVLIGS